MQRRVVIERKNLLLDDFFKVEEVFLSYERFDGAMSPTVRRLNFERGDSVAAVVYHRARNKILLVNQFRYPAYAKGPGWLTEVVAGMVGPGEKVEDALRREIAEEMGYTIAKAEHISTFYASPGGSSERIHLYYAETSAPHPPKAGEPADRDEDIEIVELSKDEAFRQVERGQIVDAKTIVGLLWLKNRLEQSGNLPLSPGATGRAP